MRESPATRPERRTDGAPTATSASKPPASVLTGARLWPSDQHSSPVRHPKFISARVKRGSASSDGAAEPRIARDLRAARREGKMRAGTTNERRHLAPVAQCLIWAMEGRGKTSLHDIYRETRRVFRDHGRTPPTEFEAEVRQTLQACCKGRPQHNGRDDFFVWHDEGYWSCKVTSPSVDDL